MYHLWQLRSGNWVYKGVFNSDMMQYEIVTNLGIASNSNFYIMKV